MPDPQPVVSPNNSTQPATQPAQPVKPVAAPAPASKPWFETTFTRDELRKNPSITRYKSADDFAASHLSLEKKLGEQGRVSLPSETSTDAERAEFYSKLGWPEKPDGYSVFGKVKELLPEGSPVNEPFINAARDAFHKLNLTDTQATGVVSMFAEQQAAAMQEEGARIQSGIDEIKKEWGHAYEENLAVAGRAIDQLATGENAIPGLADLLDPEKGDPRIGSNPVLIRLFHQLGVWMGEDKRVEGQQVTEQQVGDLAAKKKDLMAQEGYWKGEHPDHKRLIAEVKAINDQLAGVQQ